MLSLEAVPRLEAASRQFFQVLVLVLVLVVKVLVLVLVLRVTVSVLVLVLAHTVLLTSRGFDNLTTASGKVQYKLCTLMHSIRNSRCPVYLSDTVQAASARSRRVGLRSAVTSDFILPQLRTKFGELAFSHAGPAAWNNLPQNLHSITEFSIFKKHLKSHLFTAAY